MGEFVETLLDSGTPNLPVAKATIKVILIYIPVRSAGGGLITNLRHRHRHLEESVGGGYDVPKKLCHFCSARSRKP